VAGFRGGQRQADGFKVTHLTYEDDVRVFPQCRTQCFGKPEGVTVNLTLVDQAFLRFVHEFDRVLDGEDVLVTGVVDVVEHRRERGGLAGAGRPGDQHDTARRFGNFLENLAHAEFFHRQYFRRNGPEYGAGTPVVVEGVNTETGHARHFEREVGFEEFLEILALLVVHDVVDQRVNFLVLHRWQVDAADVAINTDHRRQARREVKVRSAILGTEGEQLGNIHGASRQQTD